MRWLIGFLIAILTCSQALAQSLQPDVVDVELLDVVPEKEVYDCVYTDLGGGRGSVSCSSHIGDTPDLAKFAEPSMDGRSKLGDFIKECISGVYSQKKLSEGYYISDPTPDDTLNDFPGVRIRVIVPSELFRDSYADWDGFEVIAAVEASAAGNPKGRLWLLTVNYRYRDRGGITLIGPKPSPDWDYSSLKDLDATNGRLRKIQDGIKREAEASSKQQK